MRCVSTPEPTAADTSAATATQPTSSPKKRSSQASSAPAFCQWCGKELDPAASPRKKYCSNSCKQRAYERRNLLVVRKDATGTDPATGQPQAAADAQQATAVTAHATVGASRALCDALFELRCGAEDILTAIEDGADTDELTVLAKELIRLAHSAEHHAQR